MCVATTLTVTQKSFQCFFHPPPENKPLFVPLPESYVTVKEGNLVIFSVPNLFNNKFLFSELEMKRKK